MDTKGKILKESRTFFASKGYEGTTMTMIANAVGIKKPSLYSHYSSKEQIFKDILDKEVSDYIDFLHGSITKEDIAVKDKLYKLLVEHALGDDEDSMDFYYRFIKYQPAGLVDYVVGKFAEMEQGTQEIFESILKQGKENGEIDPVLSNSQIYKTYFLLVDGLSTMPKEYKNKMNNQELLGIWEVFFRGIRKG